MKERVQNIIDNLEKRQIKGRFFDTREDAVQAVLEETGQVNTVGIGGSSTIFDLKLHELIHEQGKTVLWHWLVEPSERAIVRDQAGRADIYLTSTNALTDGGELVNIDGMGNRVSAMYYGPKKVIVVCGVNKIATDLISAIDRIKQNACPANAKRLGIKTPCAATGQCHDCYSEERICNVTTIINHKPISVDLNVFIIAASLGY